MGSVIHGSSYKALRFFREKPAALPIYWSYCARVNKDNVAWPSLRKLADETEWSFNVCSEGRELLVALQALESVEGYIRPEWRILDEKTRQRRLNLDRSEYFRPTGIIVVDGKTFHMLYIPAEDSPSAPLDDDSPDESSQRGSAMTHRADHRGDESELSSKKRSLNTSKRSRSAGKSSSKKKPQYGLEVAFELVEGVGGQIERRDGSFVVGVEQRNELAREAILLFNGYLEVLRGFGRIQMDGDEGLWYVHQEAALRLALAGTTVEDVQRYITFRYTDAKDRFWQTFPGQMKLEHLVKTLPAFEYPAPSPTLQNGAGADNWSASPENREYRQYSKAELNELSAAVEAEMKLESMMQEAGKDVQRWNELQAMSEADLQALWESFGFTGLPWRVRIAAEENRKTDPDWARRIDEAFGFTPAPETSSEDKPDGSQ